MAQLISVLAAQNVITDANTNNVSIINLVERVNIPQVNTIYPEIYVISFWKKEIDKEKEEKLTFKVRLKYASGAYFEKDSQLQGAIPAGNDRIRAIMYIQGVPLREFGDMTFVIERADESGKTWTEVGSYSFVVAPRE